MCHRGDGLCTTVVVLLCLQGAALGAVPWRDEDDDPTRTYHFSMDDDPARLKHVANIVDALELLGILGTETATTSSPTCYKVDRIVKTKEPTTEGGRAWKIGIFLYVNEMASTQPATSSSHCVTPSPSDVTADSHMSNGMNNGVRRAVVATSANNDTTVANSTELDSSEDVSHSGATQSNNGRRPYAESKLSRTQITVIAACSIVIGTFFIVALSLRLRNYIRRYKRSEHSSRRSSFRSSNVSMRHNHYYEGRTEIPLFKIAGHIP